MNAQERSLESITGPGLDPAIRLRVFRLAGAVYGFIFVAGFVTLFWGLDAIALQRASTYLAWAKLPIGLVCCVPIGMLAGWVAAHPRLAWLSVVVWIVAGAVIGWVAGHLPYEGVSWLVSLGDPYPAGHAMYPFTSQAAVYTVITMVVGALFGLPTGLLQLIVVEHAWDRSTDSNRLSRQSLQILCGCLPFVLLFSMYADNTIHEPIRRPLVSVAWAIDTALRPGSDLVRNHIAFLAPYRDNLTPNYTVYWNTSFSVVADREAYAIDVADVVADTGLIFRCQFMSGGLFPEGSLQDCFLINQPLEEWMRELATTGHLTCTNCFVELDGDVQRWLTDELPGLGSLRQVTFLRHYGGWLYQRATFDSGRAIDCRFSGSAPVVIDLCAEVGS